MRIQAINYQQQVYNRQQSSVKSNNKKFSLNTITIYDIYAKLWLWNGFGTQKV